MDLAKIGFQADTGALDKASVSLTKLKGSAKGVSPAVQEISKTMQSVATTFAGAAAAMSKSIAVLVSATLGVSKAQIKAAKEASTFAQSIYETAAAQDKLATSVTKTSTAIQKQIVDLTNLNRINKVTGVTSMSGKSAADSAAVFENAATAALPARDQMPNRFNTGNIAAQFQDIGVTASMGMNPMLIAMQQGTQLSAILNTMEKPLQGIAIAFRSIINPVSLLSIALVALAVVGLQTVNWAATAQKALYLLADAIEVIGPYAVASAALLAVLYAPTILTGIGTLIITIAQIGLTALVTGSQMAAAWLLAMGPVGWVIAGIAAVVGAMLIFRDELKNLLGFDVISSIKTGLNTVINWFLGALGGLAAVVAETWKKIKGESEQGLGEAFMATFNAQQKKDFIGGVTDTIGTGLDKASAQINKWAASIDITGGKKKKHGKTEAEKFADILTGGNNKLATLQAELDGLDTMGKMVAKLKYEQDMLNEANTKDVKLTAERRDAIDKLASKLADLDNQVATSKFLRELEKQNAALKMQYDVVLLNQKATDQLTFYTNMLNDAKEKNIELTPEFISKLQASATAMTELASKTRDLQAGFEFSKDSTKGFVNDMRSSLEEGKGIWQSFADAVMGLIDKIMDKLVDFGVNALFDGLGQTKGASGIFSMLGSMLTGSIAQGGGAGTATGGLTGFNTGLSSTLGFAKGGQFTNGIYDSPTMFAFANGGAFSSGVMGEKGSEAVMPLETGPDGSLGVRMYGDGGGMGGKPTVNVEVVVNGNATVDQENQTLNDGSELRRFIITTVNEANANGGLDSSNQGRYGLNPRRVQR